MLIKYSFLFTNFFLMLSNTEKYGKLSLHNVFYQNRTERQ